MKMRPFIALLLSLQAAVAVRSPTLGKNKIRVLQKVPKDPNGNIDPTLWTRPPSIAPSPVRIVAPPPTQAPILSPPPTLAPALVSIDPTPAPSIDSSVPSTASSAPPIAFSGPTIATSAPTPRTPANLTACEALAQGQILQTGLPYQVNFQFELIASEDKSKSEVTAAIDLFLQIHLVDELIRPYCSENSNRKLSQQQPSVQGVHVSSTASPDESCSLLSSASCHVMDTTVVLFLDTNAEIVDFKRETLSVVEKSIAGIPHNDDNTGIVKIMYLDKEQKAETDLNGSSQIVGGNTPLQQDNGGMSGLGVTFLVLVVVASAVAAAMYAFKRYPRIIQFNAMLSPGTQKAIKLHDDDDDNNDNGATMQVLEPNDTLESSSNESAGMTVEAILADLQSFDDIGLQIDFGDLEREVVPTMESRTPCTKTCDSSRQTSFRTYSSPDTVEL